MIDRERVLRRAKVISESLVDSLRRMKGCRNILVRQYGNVLDDLVYDTISTRLGDFAEFRRQILAALP